MFPGEKLSPLWEKALHSYQEELGSEDDFQTILETDSLDELLDDKQILEPFGPQGRKALDSINRLKPMFTMLNDFSAVLAVSFRAGTTVTALVWGSLRIILTLASAADNTLNEISNMLEELSLTLPRLKSYEETMPLSPELEASLLAVYQEVICFYARVINFFRSHKHWFLLRHSWSDLRSDFQRIAQRIKRSSATIESEVELTRLRRDEQKYGETIDVMANFHAKRPETPEITNYIPFAENLARIDDSRSKFNAILWIAAENLITLGQSFPKRNAVILEVKSWLSSTKSRWLLVIDNADDLDVVKRAWPAGCVGSILITSRDPTVAFSLASNGCQVTPFDTDAGSQALLHIIGIKIDSETDREDAKAITSAMGGLPLALNQIGGFIVQRKISLKSFLPLYNRNSARVDAKGTVSIGYGHTLATVWEMALCRITGSAKILHEILSFLNPDNIPQAFLVNGVLKIKEESLDFIADEMEFLDAQEVLLHGALIDKSTETGDLSVHRLVQRAVIRRMDIKRREEISLLVIAILSANFPDTYSEDVGHQVASWLDSERSLPHIESLVQQIEHFKIFESTNQSFVELLLRCSWYLYERENYSIARSYVEVALRKFVDTQSPAYASAIDLQGLIDLDIGLPAAALRAFEKAYELRTRILPDDAAFLAANQFNIGLAYTELGELETARNYLQQSIDIRLMHDSDRIGNSYSNMASLLLRMGEPDMAEAMLKRCPSLKTFSDETFLRTGNPRFSGDMVLLSRIRLAQGLYDDSLRLASKALSFRKECLGERLKVCDSLYQVAVLLSLSGNSVLAVQLLEECIRISDSLPQVEGIGHQARANYKLSQILKDLGKENESTVYLERAISLRECFNKPHSGDAASGRIVSDFEELVPWMLW
ncbi:TPR-like protein [Aspergillus similis]